MVLHITIVSTEILMFWQKAAMQSNTALSLRKSANNYNKAVFTYITSAAKQQLKAIGLYDGHSAS